MLCSLWRDFVVILVNSCVLSQTTAVVVMIIGVAAVQQWEGLDFVVGGEYSLLLWVLVVVRWGGREGQSQTCSVTARCRRRGRVLQRGNRAIRLGPSSVLQHQWLLSILFFGNKGTYLFRGWRRRYFAALLRVFDKTGEWFEWLGWALLLISLCTWGFRASILIGRLCECGELGDFCGSWLREVEVRNSVMMHFVQLVILVLVLDLALQVFMRIVTRGWRVRMTLVLLNSLSRLTTCVMLEYLVSSSLILDSRRITAIGWLKVE